jgi:hypothetical protein
MQRSIRVCTHPVLVHHQFHFIPPQCCLIVVIPLAESTLLQHLLVHLSISGISDSLVSFEEGPTCAFAFSFCVPFVFFYNDKRELQRSLPCNSAAICQRATCLVSLVSLLEWLTTSRCLGTGLSEICILFGSWLSYAFDTTESGQAAVLRRQIR